MPTLIRFLATALPQCVMTITGERRCACTSIRSALRNDCSRSRMHDFRRGWRRDGIDAFIASKQPHDCHSASRARESPLLELLGRVRRIAVKHPNEVVNTAFQRFRKPQNHRQARYLHPPFQVADEWVTRTAAFGELRLRQLAREAKFAQTLA